MSSPIFHLPPTRQSETIPRWLIAAVRGPTIPDGRRAERQGRSRAFRRGQESRSLKKDANGPAFHSFFTSVEIAQGFLFSSDDDSNSNGARARNGEFLGQIPRTGQVPGQYQHLYHLVPADEAEPRRGGNAFYPDPQRGLPAGADAHVWRHRQ